MLGDQKILNLANDFLEVREAFEKTAKKYIKDYLDAEGERDYERSALVLEIIDLFEEKFGIQIPEVADFELWSKAKEIIILNIDLGWNYIKEIIDKFNMPESYLKSDQFILAIKPEINGLLFEALVFNNGSDAIAKEIQSQTGISDEDLKKDFESGNFSESIKKIVIQKIESGEIKKMFDAVASSFGADKIISISEVCQAAEERMFFLFCNSEIYEFFDKDVLDELNFIREKFGNMQSGNAMISRCPNEKEEFQDADDGEKAQRFEQLRKIFSFSEKFCRLVEKQTSLLEINFDKNEANIHKIGIDENNLSPEQAKRLEKIYQFVSEATQKYQIAMRLFMVAYQQENPKFTDTLIDKFIKHDFDKPIFTIYDEKTGNNFLTDFGIFGNSGEAGLEEKSFLLNFGLPLPLSKLWFKGGGGEKSQPTRPGEIEWGLFYRSGMPVIWNAVDRAVESGLDMERLNDYGNHVPKEYYYLWEVRE